MTRRTALPGLRLLLAVAALIALGLCAGAAVPGSASADDDDNGDNGGGNYHLCTGSPTPDDSLTPAFEQTCTITASTGTCIQRSSEPVVVQTCTFTQTAMTREKRATASQTHNPEGFDGTQDGTQIIEVTQSNTSRKNLLNATQNGDLCLGTGDQSEDDDGDWNDDDGDGDRDDDGRCEDEDEDDNDDEEEFEDDNGLRLFGLASLAVINQTQELHQSIRGDQTATGTGTNESNAFQSQHLHERASNANAINQTQNREDREGACHDFLLDSPFTNACYTIVQDADRGTNKTNLGQVYNLFQSARDTLMGDQVQGSDNPFAGGLDHGFDQDNFPGPAPAGTPIQFSGQVERVNQRRDNTGTMIWESHGPRKGLGFQDGSPTARAKMIQDVEMSSTGPGVGAQTAWLKIECDSSGNCTGFQHAQTNVDEETNGPHTAPFILMTIGCGSAVTDNGPGCEPFFTTVPPSE